MKNYFKSLLGKFIYQKNLSYLRKVYVSQATNRLKNIPNLVINNELELEYCKKWKVFDNKINKEYFRVYANMSGNFSTNHLPDHLYFAIVEPLLNNYDFRFIGEEKNYLDKLLLDASLPKTYLRNVNGMYLNNDYVEIKDYSISFPDICNNSSILFIKPTVETGQGRNVQKFFLKGKTYTNSEGVELSTQYLDSYYKKDFIVQEFLPQCDLLNLFNPDSINTLRILTYRSITDNKVHFLHATLRVGKKGAIIDASRAGGRFCGIHTDGSLIKKVWDSKGNSYTDFNGVDISTNDYKIPNYDKVIQLSLSVAEQIHHHRVLALDVMIDKNNLPRLIEANNFSQGMFIFQAAVGPLFSDFTEEVVNYCLQHKVNKVEKYTLKL